MATPCHRPVLRQITQLVEKVTRLFLNFVIVSGEFPNQGDSVKKLYYYLIVTKNAKYTLRVANPRAADRPAGSWLPEACIIMTP
jgi:hypothetical protein